MTIQQYNNVYVFVLGRETKIALLELEQVLRRFCFYPERSRRDFGFSITTVSGNLAYINIENEKDFDPKKIISSLGGTIKIFKIIGKIERDEIANKTSKQIVGRKSDQGGKIKFGLSNFTKSVSRKDIQDMGIKIKMKLKKDLSIRYIENREGGDLQPVISAKNKLDSKGIEFGIFECHPRPDRGSKLVDSRLDPKGPHWGGNDKEECGNDKKECGNDDGLLFGKLLAVYDPVSWSKRDYGKPKSDKYSGMMPPKLARMLVNISIGDASNKKQETNDKQISNYKSQNEEVIPDLVGDPKIVDSRLRGNDKKDDVDYNDTVVFDPFCGSGNILIEAFSLGCSVVGSDISEKAVNDSTVNLDWLIESTESDSDKPQTHHIFQSDATNEELIARLDEYLPKKLAPSSYNLIIVAEPYLGKPKKEKGKVEDLRAEITELKKLYLGFLSNAKKLTPKTYNLKIIALVFPLFELENGDKYSLFYEAVDEIKELGYTPIRTLIYGRDYQVVKREIIWLMPNKHQTLNSKS